MWKGRLIQNWLGLWVVLSLIRGIETCDLYKWPPERVVHSWHRQGRSERCFCAYSEYLQNKDIRRLTTACPAWKRFVSINETVPDKLEGYGLALIQGMHFSNRFPQRHVTSLVDWAVDLGYGYGTDCNTSTAPLCEEKGLHILSVPRTQYIRDCCSSSASLFEMLRRGEACLVRTLLGDMIAGALHRIDTATLQTFSNCMKENEDPIAVNSCLAQCFHIHPDVNYLHMHTTAGVERMRDGPGDSGLGPDTDRASHPWAYNVCACEPTSWQKTAKRGFCPTSKPSDPRYIAQAVASLCKNLAGVVGLDADSLCTTSCNYEHGMSNKTTAVS